MLSAPKLAEFRRLWADGAAPRQIASAIGGLTMFEVGVLAKSLGLDAPPAPVEQTAVTVPARPRSAPAAIRGSGETFWTDERVAELRRLWDEGKSASQIERAVGAPSRSAVIGKVHRLGLEKRGRGHTVSTTKPATSSRRIQITRPEAQRDPVRIGLSAPTDGLRASAKAPRPRGAGAGDRPKRAARPTNSGPELDDAPLLDGFDDSAAAGPRHEKECFAAIEGGVRLLDAGPEVCRWPHGAGESFRFCGDPVESRSLCAAHYAMAYVPHRQPTEAQREQGRKLARLAAVRRAAGEATWK